MSDETTYEWDVYQTPRPGYETPVIIRTSEGAMSGYIKTILGMVKDSQGLTRDDFALAPPAYKEGGPVGY